MPEENLTREPDPRWPSLAASLAIGVLFYLMPEPLTVGPRWLPMVLIAAMLIPATLFHHTGRHDLNDFFGYLGLAVITLALASSLALIILRLPQKADPPAQMLKAALGLWI